MTKNIKYRCRCPSCNNYCIKWGKTSSGVTRYRCRNCNITFASHQKKKSGKTQSNRLLLKKMDL